MRSRRFRYGLIFDVLTVAFFLLAAIVRDQWWTVPADLVLAGLLLELAARLSADENWRRQAFSVVGLADLVVIVSLLLPAFVDNLAFLRVARAVASCGPTICCAT